MDTKTKVYCHVYSRCLVLIVIHVCMYVGAARADGEGERGLDAAHGSGRKRERGLLPRSLARDRGSRLWGEGEKPRDEAPFSSMLKHLFRQCWSWYFCFCSFLFRFSRFFVVVSFFVFASFFLLFLPGECVWTASTYVWGEILRAIVFFFRFHFLFIFSSIDLLPFVHFPNVFYVEGT